MDKSANYIPNPNSTSLYQTTKSKYSNDKKFDHSKSVQNYFGNKEEAFRLRDSYKNNEYSISQNLEPGELNDLLDKTIISEEIIDHKIHSNNIIANSYPNNYESYRLTSFNVLDDLTKSTKLSNAIKNNTIRETITDTKINDENILSICSPFSAAVSKIPNFGSEFGYNHTNSLFIVDKLNRYTNHPTTTHVAMSKSADPLYSKLTFNERSVNLNINPNKGDLTVSVNPYLPYRNETSINFISSAHIYEGRINFGKNDDTLETQIEKVYNVLNDANCNKKLYYIYILCDENKYDILVICQYKNFLFGDMKKTIEKCGYKIANSSDYINKLSDSAKDKLKEFYRVLCAN